MVNFNLQLFAGGEEKTEQATPKRREEARKKGQVVRSQEFGIALGILGATLLLRVSGRRMLAGMHAYFQAGLAPPRFDFSPADITALAAETVIFMLGILAPVLGGLFLISMTANFLQVGALFTTHSLIPQWQRLNPLEGAKRIFSRQSVIQLAKSVFKVGIVGYFAFGTVKAAIVLFLQLGNMELAPAFAAVAAVFYRLGLRVGCAFLVLALADYAYQYWEYEQNLRMSKQEVKEELKQSEGDPQLRGRLRARQRQMAMQRMFAAIAKADVVITNPTHLAIALAYEQEKMAAPTVVAKGKEYLAERIKAVAKEHKVPIVEQKPLAHALYAVQLGAQIPPELYQAVAEILALVYQQKSKEASYGRYSRSEDN